MVGSDADCRRSRLCAAMGRCTAKGNACVAGTDAGPHAAVEPPPLPPTAEPTPPGDAADGLGLQVALAGGIGFPIELHRVVAIDGSVPIALTAGYRLVPAAVVDLRLQYASFVADGLSDLCQGCSGGDLRLGVGFEYHLAPQFLADPWVGLDVGLQYCHFESLVELTQHTDFALQATPARLGTDLRLSRRFVVGPTVGLSFSHWLGGTSKALTAWGTPDRPLGKPWLGWVELALRVAFVPAPVGSSP